MQVIRQDTNRDSFERETLLNDTVRASQAIDLANQKIA